MTPFLRRWFDEAGALGLPFWARWLLILLAALAKVLVEAAGVTAWDLIRRIHIDVEPPLEALSDGGLASDRDLPPARPEVTDKIADLTGAGRDEG